jgi:hypothetical protein
MNKKKRSQEEAQEPSEYDLRSMRLRAIINPLRDLTYACDLHWSSMDSMFNSWIEDYGPMDLTPDFQRGHIWTDEQRVHYLENALRGIVSAGGYIVQLNCPNWKNYHYKGEVPRGFQCIDGLQRLTTVLEFMKGNIKPFGLTPADLDLSEFNVKNRFRFVFQIYDFGYRADLLQHYLDLNAGGTPHSKEEIDRVRALRDAALQTIKP